MYKAPDAFQEGLRRFLAEGGYAWVERPGRLPPASRFSKTRILPASPRDYAKRAPPSLHSRSETPRLLQLYETRLNRTLWQIVYEFDRERAEAALEYLRQRYGVSEGRLWKRHDELFAVWLMFRLADEFEAYLRSGAGREFKTKEEFGELLGTGRWLPVEAAPLFWLRLVGDPEGGAEFRNTWVTAVNMWFERMAAPYSRRSRPWRERRWSSSTPS
jgi:plasmid maintenance system killer protein